MTAQESPPPPNRPVRVGQPAPPLALATLHGDHVDLASLLGRTVLVTFLRHAG